MKYLLNFILVLCVITPLFAQVGIGTTTPDASAALQINNSSKGVLVSRMTQAQRIAIVSPATSLLVFQTDGTDGFYYYNGSAWVTFGGGSVWSLSGNSGTIPSSNMLGTVDGVDLSIITNNTETIRITSDNKIGINSATPAATLHLVGPNLTAKTPAIRIQDGNEADGYVLTSDANGNGTWVDPTTATGSDDDWAFVSGSTNTDPIYRIAGITIGDDSIPGTTYFSDPLLHIKTEPSFFPRPDAYLGFGSNSVLSNRDPQEVVVNSNLVPKITNSIDIGDAIYSWEKIEALNTNVSTSDRREKMNIQPLKYGLSTLMKLRPVSYIWKKSSYGKTVLRDDQKRIKIGFIAQELQEEIPEIVEAYKWKKDTENKFAKKKANRLAVRYSELLPLLVNATKEHETIINEINEQQQQIEALLNELKQ